MLEVVFSPMAYLAFFLFFLGVARAGEWVLTRFVFRMRRRRRPKDYIDEHAEKPNPL